MWILNNHQSSYGRKKQNVLSQSDLTGLAPLRDFQYQEGVRDSVPRKGNWDEFVKGLACLRNYNLPQQDWKPLVQWFFAFCLFWNTDTFENLMSTIKLVSIHKPVHIFTHNLCRILGQLGLSMDTCLRTHALQTRKL